MNEKIEGMKAFFHEKADQASNSVKAFVDHEDTKAAVAWSKGAINTASDEAVALGKRVAESEMGKDAATGAAIGAVLAVPIPVIGPIFGAVVGAGAGIVLGHNSGTSKKSVESDKKTAPQQPDIDLYKQLTDLDDLRQKGILSQEEFEFEKRKVLNKI